MEHSIKSSWSYKKLRKFKDFPHKMAISSVHHKILNYSMHGHIHYVCSQIYTPVLNWGKLHEKLPTSNCEATSNQTSGKNGRNITKKKDVTFIIIMHLTLLASRRIICYFKMSSSISLEMIQSAQPSEGKHQNTVSASKLIKREKSLEISLLNL